MNPEEVEKALLGSILMDETAMEKVSPHIQSDYFSTRAHMVIYRACFVLYQAQEPIDPITVSNFLKTKNELEGVGGTFYITGLSQSVPSSSNAEKYAKIIRESYVEKTTTLLLETAQAGVLNGERAKSIQTLTTALESLSDVAVELPKLSLLKVGGEFIEKTIQISEGTRKSYEMSSKFKQMNRILRGFDKGDVTIIAARPSVGKTAFCLNLAKGLALNGTAGCFVSLEMSAPQLFGRVILEEAGVPIERAFSHSLTLEDKQSLRRAVDDSENLLISWQCPSAIDIPQLRSMLRKDKRRCGIQWAIIDYLDFITSEGYNKENEVSKISRGVKGIAKELDIHIVLVCQLNRAVEARQKKDRQPQLSDLRDSGSIEQDADRVLFLYRDDYYEVGNSQDISETKLRIAKHRNGPLGEVVFNFDKSIGRYTEK